MLTIQAPCLPETDLPIVQPSAKDDLLNLERDQFMHLVRHRLLNPFQAITLTSRLICWDKMWMYFVQKLEAANALANLVLQLQFYLE